MKIIINENERGFLMKNGEFVRMLCPGKNVIRKFLGESYFIVKIGTLVKIDEVDIQILMKDENFAKIVTKVEVPDLYFGIHLKNGKTIEILKPGTYYFWDLYNEHTFELVDISEPKVHISMKKLATIPIDLYKKFVISEGEVGLLYIDGKFEEELKSGTYYYWKNTVDIKLELIDMRSRQIYVNNQEILTADKVTLRLNFVCTYKVCDAFKINNTLRGYAEQIYIVTQLALREYVGSLKFDELLEQKEDIASVILEKLKSKQESLFIEFIDTGLKDIILPGEIRDIMNTVLIAEKNAQANVISRREEVASTRSLLNTAKLMEENKTLYKLKELEYLEKICDKVGSISVGNGNLLSELGELLNTRN